MCFPSLIILLLDSSVWNQYIVFPFLYCKFPITKLIIYFCVATCQTCHNITQGLSVSLWQVMLYIKDTLINLPSKGINIQL